MKRSLEEIAVKEAKVFLKTVSEGLKVLAKGVETLAKQVDSLAETRSSAGDGSRTAARKTVRPKTAKKAATKANRPGKPPVNAAQSVFDLISRSQTGISTAQLSEKSGYDKKKMWLSRKPKLDDSTFLSASGSVSVSVSIKRACSASIPIRYRFRPRRTHP